MKKQNKQKTIHVRKKSKNNQVKKQNNPDEKTKQKNNPCGKENKKQSR